MSPKELAGRAAAALIEDGMQIGLGTGSTTAFAIQALGERIQNEGLKVLGVPTSFAAERLALQYQIPLATLDQLSTLDLAMDGADEVDADFNLIKGRGAAHTREKVVASQAKRFVVLVDDSKMVTKLGTQMPLPVEVLPMAVGPVMRQLTQWGGKPEIRMGKMKDGPVVSDQGLWILDVQFPNGIDDAKALNHDLKMLPGVLDHGLFMDMATDILLGKSDGSITQLTKS